MKLRGALLLLLLAACAGPAAATDDNPPPNPKWFVCKYETTPGEGERLQTGQNPISVSENAFPAGVTPAVGVEFNDAQGRSLIIAEDVGQPEPPTRDDCPPPNPGTTTTTAAPTTSTTTTTTVKPTTTTVAPTTTRPTAGLFAIEVEPTCPDGTLATIEITFGDRPDLDGQTGTLTFSTGGSVPLVFDSGATVEIPYPVSAGTGPVTMTYTLGAESVTRSTTFPEACAPTTTTTTTLPGATTTSSTTSSTAPSTTTTATSTTSTTVPGIGPPPVTTPFVPFQPQPPTTPTPTTTPTPPTTAPPFVFGAAATVCVREVPTIRINFQNTFPELAGRTGTLTMADVNGNVVSTQALVYRPNTTVDLLYPGTTVFDDGSISDVPGWILTDDGLWIRDPSDEFLREGIRLTYTVNPTATAFITYPPESSACANPDNPVAPPVALPPTR